MTFPPNNMPFFSSQKGDEGCPTCIVPYHRVEFGAEECLSVVEDELHHHRLDPYLHEGSCPAETGRLDLPGPGTQIQIQHGLLSLQDACWDTPQFTTTLEHTGLSKGYIETLQ